ncbi:MAG: flagellar hook assembly protein FlgD [bacterium]
MITNIQSLNYTTTSATASTASTDITGKDEFLKLLTTQLKYQDPTAPMDNKDFLAQLAQFSSLEQLLNVNGNLQANFLALQSLNNSSATDFIGKTVKATGNSVSLVENASVPISYSLAGAAEATVSIYDSNGNLVRTLDSEWQSSGDNQMLWDGKDSSGNALAPGKYTFSVSAKDTDDNSVTATGYLSGKITGVKFVNGNPVLMMGDTEISFSDIYEING